MKKMIIFLALFMIAAAAAGCTYTMEAPASPVQAIPEDAKGGSSEGQTELVPDERKLSPELLRDYVLIPATEFHPGSAGSTLGCARSAARILTFCTENQLRLEDQEKLDQMMKDACELLSEDEKGWLQENLPGLLDVADSVFSDYDGMKGLFEDAGAGDLASGVLAVEHAQEDWLPARTALEGL